jgi:hypothetical protein
LLEPNAGNCKSCLVKFYGYPKKENFKLLKVIAPHYPAIAEQHSPEVLLVQQEVSDLKIEDFSKYEQ